MEAFIKDLNGDWADFAAGADAKTGLIDAKKLEDGIKKNKW